MSANDGLNVKTMFDHFNFLPRRRCSFSGCGNSAVEVSLTRNTNPLPLGHPLKESADITPSGAFIKIEIFFLKLLPIDGFSISIRNR